MHNLFAGLMGFFMGFGAMFHGGNPAIPHTQAQTNLQANVSPNASPSGKFKGMGRRMNLSQGERPFFGTVTNVNGSTLTLQMQMPMMRFRRNPSITPTISLPEPQTITVTVDSSTQYTGGSLSDITTNTKIAGVGKVNSDGSIAALQIRINPPMPSGMPMMRDFHGKGQPGENGNENEMYEGNNQQ